MCLFTKPKPSKGGFTPGVKPVQDTDTSLPQAKTLKPEKEVSDVSYGRGRKEQQQQKAQGARSLAINLPNATQPGAQTGGLNTTQQP